MATVYLADDVKHERKVAIKAGIDESGFLRIIQGMNPQLPRRVV